MRQRRSQVKIREHLQAHFGTAVRAVHHGTSNPSSVCYKRGDQVLWASVGGSETKMADGRRIEAVMTTKGGQPQDNTIEALISALVTMPKTKQRTLRYGDVIRAPALLKAAGCEMDALLLLPPMPFPASFHRTTLIEGQVEWMWVVPVYASEARYAIRNGAAALMVRFGKNNVDVTNLQRKPPRRKRRPSRGRPAARA